MTTMDNQGQSLLLHLPSSEDDGLIQYFIIIFKVEAFSHSYGFWPVKVGIQNIIVKYVSF
jgi:hypothetical protein